jgi:two-component system response regulator DesR
MIRILIAEDQAMVLGALSALLEIESDFEVVGRRSPAPKPCRSQSAIDPTSSSPTSKCPA